MPAGAVPVPPIPMGLAIGGDAAAVRGLPQLAQKVAPAAFSFPHAGQKGKVFTFKLLLEFFSTILGLKHYWMSTALPRRSSSGQKMLIVNMRQIICIKDIPDKKT